MNFEAKLNAISTLVVIAILANLGCREQRASKEEMLQGMPPEMRSVVDPQEGTLLNSTPMIVEGVEKPRMLVGAKEKLPDDEPVIGVFFNGQARAYPLSRMSGMMEHVVNDSVAGSIEQPRAVTVTYCDMTDCIRVFTEEGEPSATSLEIGTIGLVRGQLAIFYQDEQFRQTDQIPGLQAVPFERTTWSKWLEQYPETLVYAGSDRTDTLESESEK